MEMAAHSLVMIGGPNKLHRRVKNSRCAIGELRRSEIKQTGTNKAVAL